MPRTTSPEAAPPAPRAPAPAGYVSVRRVANGYIVHTSSWEDDAAEGGRASFVFASADAAVAKMSALLIPQPKAPRRQPRPTA